MQYKQINKTLSRVLFIKIILVTIPQIHRFYRILSLFFSVHRYNFFNPFNKFKRKNLKIVSVSFIKRILGFFSF